MLINNNSVELIVNGTSVDLTEDVDIRLNKVLFNPVKVRTTQAEYSFSFELPSTQTNDRVFGYANNLSKLNKFNARYNCEYYCNEILTFKGSLICTGFDHSKKEYKCNLVSIKINDLTEIFGEMKLTDVDWYVPFEGVSTINSVNEDLSKPYYFPFVSYGAFIKQPYYTDDVGNEYTSKFNIDEYNRFWIESFPPSLNTLEHLKKCFESKGYTVLGDAYQDDVLTNVYESVNLADEQPIIYNLGNPKFGSVKASGSFTNKTTGQDDFIEQDLSFPYMRVGEFWNDNVERYNFEAVDIWNVLDHNNDYDNQFTSINENYIYDPGEGYIVAPVSGFYRVNLKVKGNLLDSGSQIRSTLQVMDSSGMVESNTVNLVKELSETCPVEIQLVKNYDGDVELIKGWHNVRYVNGNPNDTTFTGSNRAPVANKQTWDTAFPHQDLFAANPPTRNAIIDVAVQQNNTDQFAYGGRLDVPNTAQRVSSSSRSQRRNNRAVSYYVDHGYMPRSDNDVMPFDPVVNANFICGFSTFCSPSVSIIKNGYGWSKANSINNEVFAEVNGMQFVQTSGTSYTYKTYTLVDRNYLAGSPTNKFTVNGSNFEGEVSCIVHLEKNDLVQLLAVQRHHNDSNGYEISFTYDLDITALTDETYKKLKDKGITWTYGVQFDKDLNLSNFTNNEKLVSDYVQNVLDAFNLSLTQFENNTVSIDLNRGLRKTITNAIDIDDRVNTDEATSSLIEYPKSMSVRYSINKDEYGFESSVSDEYINENNWYEFGDSGYTIVQLSDDIIYNTSTDDTTLPFSYTWYCNFNYKLDGWDIQMQLPVIELSEFMADGYNYDEAMRHDGFSLSQRFWFRKRTRGQKIKMSSWMDESVYITLPSNSHLGVNLSYKNTEMSLLTEYYNFMPLLSSNFVEVDAYIRPDEYEQLSNGAKIHFDSDIYWISEINKFDGSGRNRTNIKMVKQVLQPVLYGSTYYEPECECQCIEPAQVGTYSVDYTGGNVSVQWQAKTNGCYYCESPTESGTVVVNVPAYDGTTNRNYTTNVSVKCGTLSVSISQKGKPEVKPDPDPPVVDEKVWYSGTTTSNQEVKHLCSETTSGSLYIGTETTAWKTLLMGGDCMRRVERGSLTNTTNIESFVGTGGLSYLGAELFNKSSKLKTVDLSDAVWLQWIDERTFALTNITSLKFPLEGQINNIGKYAFANKIYQETGSTAQEQLKVLESGSTTSMLNLDIVIPSSVRSVGYYAFAGQNMRSVRFEPGCKVANLYDTFFECPNLTSVYLPSDLDYCYGLFWDNRNLREIVSPNAQPPRADGFTFGTNVDYGAANGHFKIQLTKITVPRGSSAAYKADFYWGIYSDIIVEADL